MWNIIITVVLILASLLVFSYKRRNKAKIRYPPLTKEERKLFDLTRENKFAEFQRFYEENNCNPNVVQGNGVTLIMYAISLDHGLPFCKYLLEKGADVNAEDNSGRTALIMACHWYIPEMIDLFVKHKANLNHISKSGGFVDCALLALLNKDNLDEAKDLISKGAQAKAVEDCFVKFKGNLSDKAKNFFREQLRWEVSLGKFLLAMNFQKLYQYRMKKNPSLPKRDLTLAKLPAKYIEGIKAYI